MKNLNKKFISWLLFDFANTSFSIVIITLVYSRYFVNVVCQNSQSADMFWGLSISISMAFVAITSPFLGAISDAFSLKKKLLILYTLLSVLMTALLFLVQENMIILGMIIFILGNIGFEGGIVFYNSFLHTFSTDKNVGRVSGYGFAAGYLGAFATLLFIFPFIKDGVTTENSLNVRFSFIATALFFLVFSIPAFIYLPPDRKSKMFKLLDTFKSGYVQLRKTFHEIKKYKSIFRFLLAYFVYIDGIMTVIAFAAIYATNTLHLSEIDLLIFFIVVQFSAIIGSIIFGILADHFSSKKSIIASLILWIFVIIGAYFIQTKNEFYLIGLLTGSLMGSTQATSRSLMTKLTPFDKKTEFFGFYGFCGKISTILGPTLFGLISSISGNQRIAIASLSIFFILGLYFITFVKDDRKLQS